MSPQWPGFTEVRSDLWNWSALCSNEVTLGGLLDGPWVGASHQKDQAMTRHLGFSALTQPPGSPGRGEGLEMELMIDHAYVRKPPKTPEV